VVVAIGHFGNFELYARFWEFSSGLKCATTYRSLKHKSFDQLLQYLRVKTGCHYFERRTEAHKLQEFMHNGNIILGLLADQHAGDKGIRVPFLGRDCSTSAAPAVFALRYKCPLLTAICYRTALAKWEIVIGDEIPTFLNGKPREIKDICIDMNRAFEAAVHKDPSNWFWVHNKWKPPPQQNNQPPK
jgi:lauroyl/myristoyl acyltransferase